MTTYRIIIADDHPLVRGALRQALSTTFPSVAISEASSVDEAITAIETGDDTDLVLLDLLMPGMNGFTGLFTLRAQFPAIPVAIVSAHQDIAILRKAITYGAAAFIPKSAPVEQIGAAVQAVLNGDVWLPDWARDALDAQEDGAAADDANDVSARLSQLTPQQLRVLGMLSEGKLNKQIAYELSVTEATVKAHVSAILRKLGVHSRTQAVIIARELEVQPPAIEA